ncbi:MAG: hypothetical protein ACM3RX_10400 [Methanococcaceae archaeon]
MLTKGIDYYAFLDRDNFRVTFSASGLAPVSYSSHSPMSKGNFQLARGKFEWRVGKGNQVLNKGFAEINYLAGNLLRSNLNDMMSTQSVVMPNYVLSYGFYDCGMRTDGRYLTNQNQSYVYLTANYSHWMKDLAKECPEFLDRPLNILALPGAHNAGTFETSNFKQLLQNDEFSRKVRSDLKSSLDKKPKNTITNYTISNSLERIVINLACTQKDNISTMLDLGIRYFDFRPGYCYGDFKNLPRFKNKIFHQHGFVPGYSFYKFLCDVLKWLAAHPSEIVVVNLNFQGFEEASMKPDIDDLMILVLAAQLNTDTCDLAIGSKDDLNVKIKLLLNENKRLIFLNQVDAASDAQKYDSYDKQIYATIHVKNILAALNRMQSHPPKGKAYTVLQLQGTSTADLMAFSTSILDATSLGSSDAMSPLMSTKAIFDNSTYPWLANNVPKKFSPNSLLVFINDFVDNALVKHAIDITRKRIAL